MKPTTLITLGLSLAAFCTASAQPTPVLVSQFFNNTPGAGGGDRPSSDYNWSAATANNIPIVANNVSRGITYPSSSGYVPQPGERTDGAGFMFILPSNSTDAPGASLFYTTHKGISNTYQPDPQPDWFAESGTNHLIGLRLGDIEYIKFRVNRQGTATEDAEVSLVLQLEGYGWVYSFISFQATADWQEFTQPKERISGVIAEYFQGDTIEGLLSNASLPMIVPDDDVIVTGFGLLAWPMPLGVAGGDSRVRLDRFQIAVVPEPAAYAALLGLLALGVVIYRRRR